MVKNLLLLALVASTFAFSLDDVIDKVKHVHRRSHDERPRSSREDHRSHDHPHHPRHAHDDPSPPPLPPINWPKQPEEITDRPVVGILTLPYDPEFPLNYTSYIAGSYVNWIEQGGARVVPIFVNEPWNKTDYLLERLNGVLFTGGGAAIFEDSTSLDGAPAKLTQYGRTACHIMDKAKQLNDKGVYFPVWATCLGFEMVQVCANVMPETLGDLDGEPSYAQRNDFTDVGARSDFFQGPMGQYVMNVMASDNVQLLSHHHGVYPSTYQKYQNLSDTYAVLATMKDRNQNVFVSMIEAWKYPFFGSQFHPEKNIYEWTLSSPIPHGKNAVLISTYLVNFFMDKVRSNPQSFWSEEELKPHLIYNWEPYFYDGYFTILYLFNN